MKLYNCTNCRTALYFENSACLNCNHAIGFEAGNFNLLALEKNQNTWLPVNNQNENCRYCANAAYDTCNWLIPASQAGDFFIACALNRVIPELSIDKNRQKWTRIETAKHRLVYSLLRLHLPVYPKINDTDTNGITFDFMGDVTGAEKIMTGHDNGVIALNIEEADEGERVKHKLDLGEQYRTLLGHFRHEIGHYYWEILIKDSPHLEKFRQLFGNEEKDYSEALEIYYKTDTPSNWNYSFISPYATSHAWED
jgi:hypothetical protein